MTREMLVGMVHWNLLSTEVDEPAVQPNRNRFPSRAERSIASMAIMSASPSSPGVFIRWSSNTAVAKRPSQQQND